MSKSEKIVSSCCKSEIYLGAVNPEDEDKNILSDMCSSCNAECSMVNKPDDVDLIIWDLETTGFVAPKCKILEIGCFIVRGEEIEQKHWVLNNNVEIPEIITEITGITKDIIDAEGRDPKECINEFLPLFELCKKNVTHNGIRFDIPFLVETATEILGLSSIEKMHLTKTIKSTAFDTAVHFKAKKLNMEPFFRESHVKFADRVMSVRAAGVKYALGVCVEELGIDKKDLVQHRAMADVELTYEVYKTTVNQYD